MPADGAAEAAYIQRLEQDLAAAREEATSLHEMLEDLPGIFERKFRQRLHVILEQQQLLLADNRMLREQLFALQPAAEPGGGHARLLPPGAEGARQRPEPLRRVLRGVRRLSRGLRSTRLGGWSRKGDDELSDRDDGRPRAA